MSVEVLEGEYLGRTHAVMIDNCSGFAFGPLFADAEECLRFQTWLRVDARYYSATSLVNRVAEFRCHEREAERYIHRPHAGRRPRRNGVELPLAAIGG